MTTARGGRSYLGHSRQWMVPVLLFVLALPAITPRLYASDEVGYFANLRSLWFDHDVSFDNEYRYFYDRGIAVAWTFYESYLVRETATGLRYSYWTVGPAILWSPFYAVADVTTRVRRAFGSEVPADGYSRPYLRAVTLGSAFYGFLAICIAIVTARRLVGEAHPAGLAIWLGTPLLHYMYIAPGFSHACSAFAAALFVAVWLRVRETWSLGGLMGLGAVCALMVMVREQAVLFVVGPAIDYLWSVAGAARAAEWARVRTLVVRVAAGAAVSLLCYSPQLLIYQTLYGQFTTPYTLDNRMLWYAPHLSDVLFHPNHGFFFWTPLALVAVGGLAWFAWSGDGRGDAGARRVGICLLAMFASQAYIAGAILRWELSGTFGQRRFIGTTIILVIGLGRRVQAGAASRLATGRRDAGRRRRHLERWPDGPVRRPIDGPGTRGAGPKRLHDGVRPAARIANARVPLPLRPQLVLPRPGTLRRAVRDAVTILYLADIRFPLADGASVLRRVRPGRPARG